MGPSDRGHHQGPVGVGIPPLLAVLLGFVTVSPGIMFLFVARRRRDLREGVALDVTRLGVALWVVCLALIVAAIAFAPRFLWTGLVLIPASALAIMVQVMLLARRTRCDLRLLGHTFGCQLPRDET